MSNESPAARLLEEQASLAASTAAAFTKMNPVTATDMWLRIATLGLYAKSYKSYRAAHYLWSQGFAEDALVLVRTLFEVVLNLEYLSREGESAVRRWHDCAFRQESVVPKLIFGDITGNADAPVVLRFRLWGSDLIRFVEDLDHALGSVAALGVFEPNKIWCGLTVKELAVVAGDWAVKYYNTLYRCESMFTHSHPGAVKYYYGEPSDGRLDFFCEPDIDRASSVFPFVPWLASCLFTRAVQLVATILGLALEEEIERSEVAAQEFREHYIGPRSAV